MPPVHYIPLLVLMPAAADYLPAAKLRVDEQEICTVLQLIAETYGAAALIYAAAPHYPAGQTLVYGPGVHIMLQCGIAAFYAEPAAELCPVFCRGA